MFFTFKEALTEVFIRTIEANPKDSIDKSATKISTYIKDRLHNGDAMDIGSFRAGAHLYVTSLNTGRDDVMLFYKDFSNEYLKILDQAINKLQMDVRECFALHLENQDWNTLTDFHIKTALEQKRRDQPLPDLIKEITIRLLEHYPELKAEEAVEIIKTGTGFSGLTFYSLPNYPWVNMLKLKTVTPQPVITGELGNAQYLAAIDVLRELSYDVREAFYTVNTANYYKIFELDLTREQHDVLYRCLDCVMSFLAVHNDCREATEGVMPLREVPTGVKSLDRAIEILRDDIEGERPDLTSFIQSSAEDFTKLRALNISTSHVTLISPSDMAQLIFSTDMQYRYSPDWQQFYPFISPDAMQKVLKMGVTCEALLAAERAVFENHDTEPYAELGNVQFLLNQTSFKPPVNISTNQLSSTALAGSTGSEFNVTARAIASSSGTSTALQIYLGSLLFLGLTGSVVMYRSYNKVKKFCSGLNLFGGANTRAIRNSVDTRETTPLMQRR